LNNVNLLRHYIITDYFNRQILLITISETSDCPQIEPQPDIRPVNWVFSATEPYIEPDT
jgi:hypothetical protein